MDDPASSALGLDTMVTMIPVPAFVLDEGMVLHQNAEAMACFSDLRGKPFALALEAGSMLHWLQDQDAQTRGEAGSPDTIYRLRSMDGLVNHQLHTRRLPGNPSLTLVLAMDQRTEVQSRAALRTLESRFHSLAAAIPDLAWTMDTDLSIDWLNPASHRFFGVRVQDPAGLDLPSLVGNECRIILQDQLSPRGLRSLVQSGGGKAVLELALRKSGGIMVWTEVTTTLERIPDAHGIERETYLCIGKDVSERRKTQALLGQSEERSRQILQSVPVPIMVMLHDWSIESVNRKFTDSFGWQADDVPHMENWWDRSFPDPVYRAELREKFMEMVGNAALHGIEAEPMVVRAHCKDGEQRVFECRFIYLPGLGLWAFNDITDLRRNEERLRIYATRDELTGVFNRRSGLAVLERALATSRETGAPLSIAFVDVNNLKEANDAFGHAAGDELIVSLVRHIEQGIRRSDTLFRIGGDEFVLVLPNCPRAQATDLLAQIRGGLGGLSRDERPYLIDFSVGIEEYRPGQGIDELLALADKAMYQEKRLFHRQEDQES